MSHPIKSRVDFLICCTSDPVTFSFFEGLENLVLTPFASEPFSPRTVFNDKDEFEKRESQQQ